MPHGKPRWIRVYDGGPGCPGGRYTVLFVGRFHEPVEGKRHYHIRFQGSCRLEWLKYPLDVRLLPCGKTAHPAMGEKCSLGRRVCFEDLPVPHRNTVRQAYKYLWGLDGNMQ